MIAPTAPEAIRAADPERTEPGGWLVALGFWLCLVAAAALYAIVALAPGCTAWRKLEAEYHTNQINLVALEQEIERLARIGDALANEPAYAAEQARVDFPWIHKVAEPIAVEPRLQLNDRAGAIRPSQPAVVAAGPGLLLEAFASDRDVRRATLAAAGLLAVFAFAFLHDGHAEQARAFSQGLRLAAGRLRARYRRPRAG